MKRNEETYTKTYYDILWKILECNVNLSTDRKMAKSKKKVKFKSRKIVESISC